MTVLGQQLVRRGENAKPIIHLCEKHYRRSDWSDKDVVITGRQSCDICKEDVDA